MAARGKKKSQIHEVTSEREKKAERNVEDAGAARWAEEVDERCSGSSQKTRQSLRDRLL